MKEQQQPITEQWVDVRKPGEKGINTIDDQHDIDDQEATDLLNMWFDAGVIGARPGSRLFASKFSGESGTPAQLMVAKTSDGVNYIITRYTTGTATNNFYVWDSTNSYWVKINGTSLPTFTSTAYFGSQSWDYGYAFDSFYFCNGYDDMCKWRMSLDHLATNTAAGDLTLTLNDGTRFFNYSTTVSAISGNVLTLNTSSQSNALYTNQWELGQQVFYTGTGITGLTNGTIYYAVPTAYSLPTNGISGNSLALATTLANAIAGTVITLGGSPSGTVTIYKAEPLTLTDGTNVYSATYYTRSGNTLSLTGQIGSVIGAGATVTPTITDRPGCPKGNILTTWAARMVVGNCPATTMSIWNPGGSSFQTYPTAPSTIVSPTTVSGSSNTMWLSRISAPEDYITNKADISSGGNQVFNDGAGSLTDIKDFGEFLIVSKSNVQYRFSFIRNQDLSAQFPQVVPIISGIGMGPVNFRSSLKAMNSIYYPTTSAGFIQLSPVNTGVTSSTGLQVISYKINNLIQSGYDFSSSRGVFYYNKLLWTATNPNSQNTMFMLDTIRNAWTKFDNWNPVDLAVTNSNTLYFLGADGNVYQGFSGYTDNSNPYNVYYKTKLHNFGRPSMVKTMDAICVEGYMTQSTSLYADVLYNEKGRLFTQTYKMAVGVTGFQFTNVAIGGLAYFPFSQSILDTLTPSQIQNFGYFRCFLSVPNSYGLFAVQIKFYSVDPNSVWFLTGYGMNPKFENMIPPHMRVDSTTPTVVTLQ